MAIADDLDDVDRRLMLEEVDRDIAEGPVYLSPRLSPSGQAVWPGLLREAVERHDLIWLQTQLRVPGRILTHEMSHRKGVPYSKAVPANAAETLAEGEVNRLYIRGQCLRAIGNGQAEVEVYRAKEVSSPRAESKALIGTRLDARRLLEDLRHSVGVESALGVPPGPNSGLSARCIRGGGGES